MKTKTEIVKEFCEENGVPLKDIKMSAYDPSDGSGRAHAYWLNKPIELADLNEVDYVRPLGVVGANSKKEQMDIWLRWAGGFNSIAAATSFYDFMNGKPMLPITNMKSLLSEEDIKEDINKAMITGKRGDMYATESKKPEEYGCACGKCKEFYEHAIRKDGFVCRSCKSYENM